MFVAASLQIYSVNQASGASQYVVATAVTVWLLMWTTWSSQVHFDTRFRTEDWVNATLKLCAFGVYGYLAAYTNFFDISALGDAPIEQQADGSTDIEAAYASTLRAALISPAIASSQRRPGPA